MKILKLGNTSFNINAFKNMSKEDFVNGNYSGEFDAEWVWNKIQQELKQEVKTEEEDVQTTSKAIRKGQKGS